MIRQGELGLCWLINGLALRLPALSFSLIPKPKLYGRRVEGWLESRSIKIARTEIDRSEFVPCPCPCPTLVTECFFFLFGSHGDRVIRGMIRTFRWPAESSWRFWIVIVLNLRARSGCRRDQSWIVHRRGHQWERNSSWSTLIARKLGKQCKMLNIYIYIADVTLFLKINIIILLFLLRIHTFLTLK